MNWERQDNGTYRVIDLSHPIREGMQIYPGDPVPLVERGLVHESDYCHVDRLVLGSHTGTHIDAPYHFLASGARIDEFDVSRFVGRGVIVDVTGKAADEAIEAADLLPYKGKIKAGDFVLFYTGWDRYFGSEAYLDHPYLSPACAEALTSMGVTLVGVDFLNVDPTKQEVFPVHDILLSKDIFIVENIANLVDIGSDTAWFSFLPLKVSSDGSPVRAMAIA
jgi:kynurenine formamidase